MRKTAFLIISGMVLAGCATDINMVNASRYHEAGLRAEWAGDYKAAEEFFRRSLINARDGKASDSTISMAMYNLGRMKGLNCQYEEARTLLTESLKLEETISGTENGLVTKRLFELARFSYDRQQYTAAADYYGRAIALGRKLGLAKDDPIALADATDEYATALRNSGRDRAADAATADARALRMENPGAKAKYSFPRYNRSCAA